MTIYFIPLMTSFGPKIKLDLNMNFLTPGSPRKLLAKWQLMDFLKYRLDLKIPAFEIQKFSGKIIVAQKSLSSRNERIENARSSFFVPPQSSVKNLLLLDDVMGSGASLNEVAKKIMEKKLARNIFGLALVGSNDTKAFSVVREA